MFSGLFLLIYTVSFASCLNLSLLQDSPLYGLSYLSQIYENSTCYHQLSALYKAIEVQQNWALKVLDASGRPEAGFFYGNNLWLGSYAQCIDLENTEPFKVNHDIVKGMNATPYDYPPFSLGFFVAHFAHNSLMQQHGGLPLEFTVQIGLCLPSSCSTNDLNALVEHYLSLRYLLFQNLYKVNLTLTLIRNVQTNGEWFLPNTIIFLTLLLLLLTLNAMGTFYDIKTRKNLDKVPKTAKESVSEENSWTEILKCFSLHSNIGTLLKSDLPPNSLTCIYGLRFFGMLWIMLGHAIFYQIDFLDNTAIVYRLSENFFTQILSNVTYAVDTYFFLSGFLLSYLFFLSKPSEKKLANFFIILLKRFLRLTPPYAITILLADIIYSYYRKSSVLYSSEYNDLLCQKYWWRNLLYINNLFPRSEMCLSWSWYLSVDTQCFIISLVLLLLSTTYFKVSAAAFIFLLFVNITTSTYTSYRIKYIPTLDSELVSLDAIYDLPWIRMGPYLIGVITGYLFVEKMGKNLNLTKRCRIFLWILFPCINLWILFTTYTRNMSVAYAAVYMGVSRSLWGLGIAWVLVACSTGNAKLLDKFLSFRVWIPLSKLTYSVYLLNPLFAIMFYMGANRSLNASVPSFALEAFALGMASFLAACVMFILLEAPTGLFTKYVVKKLSNSQ